MGVMWGLLYMAPAFRCPNQKNVHILLGGCCTRNVVSCEHGAERSGSDM